MDVDKIRKWQDRLTNIKDIDDSEIFRAKKKKDWIITDFAKTVTGESLYIVQPLEVIDGQEGCTGFCAYALKEAEIIERFVLKGGE